MEFIDVDEQFGGPPPERDLSRYGEILRRRWRLGLLVFVIVVAGVSAGLLLQPPVYRATGLLEIRRETTSAVPVESLFGSERLGTDELETQFGILRSQTLATRVIDQLTRAGVAVPPTPERLRRELAVDPQKGSRLVAVSYDAHEPELAAGVVNAVFDNYLQLRGEESQRSAELLESQLRDTKQKLEESEARLHAYVRSRGLEVLETGKGELATELNERLRGLNEQLSAAQAERFAKQSAYELAVQRSKAGEINTPVVESLTVKLADLRREQAKLASVFHEEYPALLAVKNQIAELESALDKESQIGMGRLSRDYQASLRREQLLRQSLEQQNSVARAIGDGASGYESLKRDVLTNQQMFTLLDQRLKEVKIASALKASSVGIVDRPQPPQWPVSSSPGVNIGLAALVGLFMAVGMVFLREHLDTSVRNVEDVNSFLGVPALAAIPAVSQDMRLLPRGAAVGPRRQWRRIDQPGARSSPLAEAFAALRTAVLLGDDNSAPRVVLVTSAQSAEGKTTVSVNLALSLARLNHRVLLVDANMRFPCIHEALGIGPVEGLSEYLDSNRDWRLFVRPASDQNLDVLACGEPAASPADVLSLPRMRQLVDEASREYDFVIMDSPALLANPADVRSLAAMADNVLLTVRQGWTPREAVSMALSQLSRVSGVVLNRSDFHDVPAYQRDISVQPT